VSIALVAAALSCFGRQDEDGVMVRLERCGSCFEASIACDYAKNILVLPLAQKKSYLSHQVQ